MKEDSSKGIKKYLKWIAVVVVLIIVIAKWDAVCMFFGYGK